MDIAILFFSIAGSIATILSFIVMYALIQPPFVNHLETLLTFNDETSTRYTYLKIAISTSLQGVTYFSISADGDDMYCQQEKPIPIENFHRFSFVKDFDPQITTGAYTLEPAFYFLVRHPVDAKQISFTVKYKWRFIRHSFRFSVPQNP